MIQELSIGKNYLYYKKSTPSGRELIALDWFLLFEGVKYVTVLEVGIFLKV